MSAGSYDRRVIIERFTQSRDEFNNQVKTWSPLATVWASKHDVSDGERARSQIVAAVKVSRFRVRYSSAVASVNPKDRLVCEGLTYDINGVKEIGRRRELEITATTPADLVPPTAPTVLP